MRLALATLTVTCLLPGMAAAQEGSADDQLRRAREARATWDESFPGFTADLVIQMDSAATRGKVQVSPEGDVAVEAPEGQARAWAVEQLRSEVLHHRARPSPFGAQAEFAEPEGKHPLGRLIRLEGDRMGSSYRIAGDQIREVNRTMGGEKFSIKVLLSRKNAEGKYLPEVFTVTYWDAATGDLKKVETFSVSYIRLGRYDLPATRTQVVSEDKDAPVRRLELSNHRLGGAAASP
ncbi:MAG: DUF3386 family protein [Isosphaeraceae bacterium]|nr:DUF3386 family protein [Isosphaeraceae bacterium]